MWIPSLFSAAKKKGKKLKKKHPKLRKETLLKMEMYNLLQRLQLDKKLIALL